MNRACFSENTNLVENNDMRVLPPERDKLSDLKNKFCLVKCILM
jgi:hypothetical protein